MGCSEISWDESLSGWEKHAAHYDHNIHSCQYIPLANTIPCMNEYVNVTFSSLSSSSVVIVWDKIVTRLMLLLVVQCCGWAKCMAKLTVFTYHLHLHDGKPWLHATGKRGVKPGYQNGLSIDLVEVNGTMPCAQELLVCQHLLRSD